MRQFRNKYELHFQRNLGAPEITNHNMKRECSTGAEGAGGSASDAGLRKMVLQRQGVLQAADNNSKSFVDFPTTNIYKILKKGSLIQEKFCLSLINGSMKDKKF